MNSSRITAKRLVWKLGDLRPSKPFPVPPSIQVLKTNAFCPTGKGGGVDPSCSPGKKFGGFIIPGSRIEPGPELVAEIAQLSSEFKKSHPNSDPPAHLVNRGKRKFFGGQGASDVNALLRNPAHYDDPNHHFPEYMQKTKKKAQAILGAMNDAFDSGSLTTDGEVVYRRMYSVDVKEGQVFENKGFMSTSLSYSHGSARHPLAVNLIIRTPKGAPALFYDKEAELVFQPGTKLKIKKVGKIEGEMGTFAIAEMLPPTKQSNWRVRPTTNSSPTITSLTAIDSNGNEFSLPKSAITNELVQSLTTNATVRPNPLLMDPTGTGKERKALERAIMSRLKMLKQAIVETIVTEDVFGLKDRPSVYTSNLASTQVNITDPKILTTILDIQNRIDPADLVEFEDKSHITVRYGLHDLDPKRVEWIVSQHSSVRVKLGGLSIFPAKEPDSQRGGPEYDVLKIDVSSKDLESINRHLGILPNTPTHPDYHPHLTVAYLKPGTGQKYVGASGLEGVELEFKSMVYSDDDRKKTEIVFNAFCPTGKGGGVDPTCGKGQSNRDYKTLTRAAAKSEGFQVVDSSDPGMSDKLQSEEKRIFDLMGDMEEAENDQGHEYEALFMMSRVLYTHNNLKLSEKQNTRTSFVLKDGKAVAGGLMTWDSKKKEAFVKYVGSTERGAGKYVMASLLQKARDKGITVVKADASDEAVPYNRRFGFDIDGPKNENGIPMSLALNQLTTNAGIWEFVTDDQKVEEFIKWIRSQMSVAVLGTMTTLGTTDPDHWLMKHIQDTYTKGMGKVFEFIRKPIFAEKMPHYEGTKAEFLKSAFTRPVSPNRVKLLAGRAYSELSGMTDKMATQMQRSLTDGFIRGESPRDIARQLVKDVDGLGRKQANMIASTEITRAYNEGQLDSMEELGVEDVGVSVEWRVSKQGVTLLGNPSPCPVCAPLNGIVLKISEARGLLPRHPHCRCAWVASGVGESTKGQKRSQQRIVLAVKSSLMAERPKRKKTAAKPSRWAGSKAKIGKNRPKSILD